MTMGDKMYKLKIRKYRKLKKLTQKELAIRIGISQNYLSEVENGKYDIRVSLLFKVGHALERCPKDLIECEYYFYDCKKCLKRKALE